MRRTTVRLLIIGAICLFVGIASGAVAMALVPNPGTPPSIYDDFAWSSTADGFLHVNAIGAAAEIKHNLLTLSGHDVELDRRLQTDPRSTGLWTKERAAK